MCGIAGIADFSQQPVDRDVLNRMQSAIAHRGPDGAGIYTDTSVGLVHTRLSILDLSESAHQPMLDKQADTCISYNGEIYNFQDIRKTLKDAGVEIQSTGDTEVLLKACSHFGVEETLQMLNGMFAFAFWDAKKRELWLARDRTGIKPLYYTLHENRLLFASEIKALLPFAGTAQPDLPVLYEILNGGTSWEPYTFFAGIYALNPGHYLRIKVDNPDLEQKEYFSLFGLIDEARFNEYKNASMDDVAAQFRELMTESVKIHSISDAPLATLASGGIDSSLISSLAANYCPGLSLYHADIIGEQSEKQYAQAMADYLNCPLVTAAMTPDQYTAQLVNTTWSHEAPSAYHPNDVPFQLVAKRAHEDGIKVLLTGEGADELFIGYGLASKQIIRNKLKYMVSEDTPLLGKGVSILKKLSPAEFSRSITEPLATRGVAEQWMRRAEDAYSFVTGRVEREALVDASGYMKAHLNSLLQRNDRMGMMHALESRIPFLENNIVRFAVNLPLKFKHPATLLKMLGGNPLTRNKTVVRKSAQGLVPDTIIKRKKMGFPVTPERYLRLDQEFYKDGFLEQTLGIRHDGMQKMLDGLDQETRWNLFSTELFGKMFFTGDSKDALADTICSLAQPDQAQG